MINPPTNIWKCIPEYPFPYVSQPHTRLYHAFRKLSHYLIHQNPLNTIAVSLALLSLTHRIRHRVPFLNKYSTTIYIIGIALLLKISKEWIHLPFSLTVQPLLIDYCNMNFRTSMRELYYTPRECSLNGHRIARLRYGCQNGRMIPFLEFFTEHPTLKGFARGLLLGNEINQIFLHAIRPMKLLLACEGGDFSGSKIKQNTANFTFFEEHIDEIKAMLGGIQECTKRTGSTCNITLDDLKSVHIIPDTYKQIFFSLGCSTIIAKENGEVFIGRVLDWLSLDYLGRGMVVCVEQGTCRNSQRRWRSECLTFPGYIGNLTVTNGTLTLIINEDHRISHCSGMAHCLFLRELIREATTVEEVEKLINEWSRHERHLPASSFHLIACDTKGEACVFQFYADKRRLYIKRVCKNNDILVVTNHAVDDDDRVIPGTASSKTSELRAKLMKEAFHKKYVQRLSTKERIIRALQPHPVNSKASIGCVVYSPGQPPEYAFDNSNAASHMLSD